MFEHNYIKKLAFDNVKKQKKFYKFLFSALVLIFGLSTMVSILLPSFEQIGFRERYTSYGLWSVAIANPTQDKIDLLKDNSGLEIGHIYNVGNISYKDRNIGTICSLDDNGVNLTTLRLLEGRAPQNNNEIMIAEEQFLALGIPKQINQDIELSISNDKTITKTYKIVGIVKDFVHIYPIALSSYITVGETSKDNITLFNAENNLDLWNSIIDNEMESDVQLNQKTYIGYNLINTYIQRDSTVMFRWFVIVLGFAGVIGTMTSAMSKRTGNLVLMKAIGATSKQIQKMIVYEGVILCVVAGILGITIGLLASLGVLSFYCSLTGSDFIFILSSIFFIQIVLSFITSIIAIFISTFKVNRIPLVGQLQQKVKVAKKRKIRKLNVFSLGIREFTQHKMISVLLIVIIFMGIMVCELFSTSFSEYIYLNKDSQKDKSFDYILEDYNQEISTQDINTLKSIKGITSQVMHQHEVYMTWEGIEKELSAREYRSNNALIYPTLPQYCEKVTVSYYENEKMLQDIFDKYSMQGRLPKNDNEVVVFKPFMQYHDSGAGSSPTWADTQSYVHETGLEIDDSIYAYNTTDGHQPSEAINEPFKIVGIILFEDEITRKERDIISSGGSYNI
ncbi:MAG: ABC transporter permease, partial [Coprobacillus sp.]